MAVASPRSRYSNQEAKVFEGVGNSECKGPGVGMNVACLKGRRPWLRGKMVSR